MLAGDRETPGMDVDGHVTGAPFGIARCCSSAGLIERKRGDELSGIYRNRYRRYIY